MKKRDTYWNIVKEIGIVSIVIVSTVLCALIRYREGEIEYFNSDATWHSLLTIESYNETPAFESLFLPIVSLGEEGDKGIPWGAAVPDSKGNYYYTSFSPAGYFLPWLFFKLFNLSVCEKSLYIFNTILFCISALFLVWLLFLVYSESSNRDILCLLGGISYITLPELLHGMGIVYWHQSLLQVTLLLQIIYYYRYAVKGEKKCVYIFYVLALINPYIEWTGYVANIGFALAELIRNWKINWKRALFKSFWIGIITLASFILFLLHYLTRISFVEIIGSLKNRFMVRSVTTPVSLTDLFGGYYKSFLFLWILLLILVVWCYIRNENFRCDKGSLILVMAFPIIENVLMKQHATAYSYDRMKAAFVLIIIICEGTRNILENSNNNQKDGVVIICLAVLCSLLNLNSYMKDVSYIWDVDYKADNQLLADYITEKYPNSLYASDTQIRGYMNLLFDRGIYENVSFERATEIAVDKGIDSVVYIIKNGYKIHEIKERLFYSNECKKYTIVDGSVVCNSEENYYSHLADFSDDGWINGCLKSTNTVLFNRDDELLIQLLSHNKIKTDEGEYTIMSVDYDDLWIRVKLDKDVSSCMYPNDVIVFGD